MEDVLDVYQRPYDTRFPLVRIDETCKEIHADAIAPILPRPPEGEKPATPARQDYEYIRDGSASVFLVYEPLTGICHAEVRPRRTAPEYERMIKHLCDTMYPHAVKINRKYA
jgi:hypothetical protein